LKRKNFKEFWSFIKKNEILLINSEEHEKSNIKKEIAENFLKNDNLMHVDGGNQDKEEIFDMLD